MNNSWRRINEDVIEILTQPKETAFDGTVKEGFIRKYTIINERDFRKYVPDELKEDFSNVFNKVAEHIEEGRVAEGKSLITITLLLILMNHTLMKL